MIGCLSLIFHGFLVQPRDIRYGGGFTASSFGLVDQLQLCANVSLC